MSRECPARDDRELSGLIYSKNPQTDLLSKNDHITRATSMFLTNVIHLQIIPHYMDQPKEATNRISLS